MRGRLGGRIPFSVISGTSTPGPSTERCRLQPHLFLSPSSLAPQKCCPGQSCHFGACQGPERDMGAWCRELGEPSVPSRQGLLPAPASRSSSSPAATSTAASGGARGVTGEREGKRAGARYCTWGQHWGKGWGAKVNQSRHHTGGLWGAGVKL